MAGPPGVGKSYIARTIQRTVSDTAIITPSNILVDQYCSTYSELNGVKGKDYYSELSDYTLSRVRAETEPSVFNPLSFYYYYLRRPHLPKPKHIIVDEAHSLGNMLLLTIAKSYSCKYYGMTGD